MRVTCAIIVFYVISAFVEGRRYNTRPKKLRPISHPVIKHKDKHGHVDSLIKPALVKPPVKVIKSFGKDMVRPETVRPLVSIKPGLVKPLEKNTRDLVKPIFTDCPPLDVCGVQRIPDRCREETFIRFNGRLCPGCDRNICGGREGRWGRNDRGRRFNPVDQFLDSLIGREGGVDIEQVPDISRRQGNALLGTGVPIQRGILPRSTGVSAGPPPMIDAGSGSFGQIPQIPGGEVQVIPSAGRVTGSGSFGRIPQITGGGVQVFPSSGRVQVVPPGSQLDQFPEIPRIGGALDQFPQTGPIELALPPQLQNQPGQTIGQTPGAVRQFGNGRARRVQGGDRNPFQSISREPFSGRFQDGFTPENIGLFQDVSSLSENSGISQVAALSPGGANSWATGSG